MHVSPQSASLLANDQGHFGVRFQPDDSINDMRADLLQTPRRLHQASQSRTRWMVLPRVDQAVLQRRSQQRAAQAHDIDQRRARGVRP